MSDATDHTQVIARLTRERDQARTSEAAQRERAEALLQQCDRLAAEVMAWRTGEATPWAPAFESDEARRLAQAQATIRNMERSWFWRARMMWVRIRRVFNRAAS
jgi:hypothetical protein